MKIIFEKPFLEFHFLSVMGGVYSPRLCWRLFVLFQMGEKKVERRNEGKACGRDHRCLEDILSLQFHIYWSPVREFSQKLEVQPRQLRHYIQLTRPRKVKVCLLFISHNKTWKIDIWYLTGDPFPDHPVPCIYLKLKNLSVACFMQWAKPSDPTNVSERNI